MLSNKTIKRLLLLICLILGLVFLFSGVSKVLWSHAFERALNMYNLNLPEVIEKSIRIFLPLAEIILGILLFLSKFRKLALFISIIFLTSFTTAQVWVVAHGWNVPCGCFGPYVKEKQPRNNLIISDLKINQTLIH